MIENLPILTIAIPTFNRIESLKVLMRRLRSELAALECMPGAVELIVVDNSSTDGTQEFLEEERKEHYFQYIRQSENVGMDRNFATCFLESRGKWFWLLSDDDLPMIGTVAAVVSVVSESSSGLLYLPPLFYACDLGNNKEAAQGKGADVHSESAEKFAKRVNGMFTFISSIVANREHYVSLCGLDRVNALVGTYFAHLEWVFENLKSCNKFEYFNGAMICARAENSGGFNYISTFTRSFSRSCMQKLSDKKSLWRLVVDGMCYRHMPKNLLMLRVGSAGRFEFSAHEAAKYYREAYGANPHYWLVIFPILRFPLVLAKLTLCIGRVWGKVWYESK